MDKWDFSETTNRWQEEAMALDKAEVLAATKKHEKTDDGSETDGTKGKKRKPLKYKSAKNKVHSKLAPPPNPVVQWTKKNIWNPTSHLIRTEASHQEYIVRSVYQRQPRHVGHFLFKLIESLDWIPRYVFDWACFLLHTTTVFAVQVVDLAVASTFRALWAFPWASTLFFALVAALPSIPYAYWVDGDVQKAVLFGLLYAAWFLRMSHLYIDKPERWLGYTQWQYFPWLNFRDLLWGPYVLLAAAAYVFVHFEKHPVHEPLFDYNYHSVRRPVVTAREPVVITHHPVQEPIVINDLPLDEPIVVLEY
ncbi:hypothetical protein BJ166DRAFT_493609 [Pestalotiopsis sp. NC0098]|nr:hypothetical protein BJ166DRAFT_493609 [Pestalotiopsis sp. NC0098]